MGRLTIRLADVEDTPEIVRLGMQFADNHPLGKWANATPDKLESVMVPLMMEFGFCVVAEKDGRMIGVLAVLVQPSHMGADTFGEELAWWVDPDDRGTAGLRMLDFALVACSQRGVTVCNMSTPFGSPVGQVLERRGFEAVQTTFLKRLDVIRIEEAGPAGHADASTDAGGRRGSSSDDTSDERPPSAR